MAEFIVKAGDRIRVPEYVFGHHTGWNDFTVVNFRNTLGIFGSPQAKTAGDLTPLCELYERGPESENDYIPNYGPYVTNMVPAFILLADKADEK